MNTYPNFFIIGASKCGTTSLYNLLSEQDGCCMSSIKEPFYFNRDNIEKDLAWYISLFEHCKGSTAAGEASPIYSETTYFPYIPARIHDFNPHSKIIYIIRHPYERLKSVWKQTLSSGHVYRDTYYRQKMPNDFTKAILGYPPFLEACKYWTHIQNYRKYFSDSDIKIIYFEDFITDTGKVMNDLAEFLSLGKYKPVQLDQTEKNTSKGKQVFSPALYRISKIRPLKSISKFVPDSIINKAVTRISGTVPDDPSIPGDAIPEIKKSLEPQLPDLFKYTGKPSDFWTL